MKPNPNEIDKKYYSISEVAKMFEVNTSLIRFWETEFEIINPLKNKNGERRFTDKDIKDLKIIYHLVKEKGFTLDGAKEHLKKESKAEEEKIKTLDRLIKIRNFLANLRDGLE